jgi:hypothetical protein
MFLLTFYVLGLNILLVPAESAKADAKRIRKQRGRAGTHDIILSENKAADNTVVVFVLESERRTLFK